MEGLMCVKVLLIVAIICISGASSFSTSAKVATLYNWKTFAFEGLPHSQYAKVNGYNYYISKDILPTAVSYHDYSGCMFLVIARYHPGIPATITYVNTRESQQTPSPALNGFPTYRDNFIPGWFGVDDLSDNNYPYAHNIYPDYSQRRDEVNKYENIEEIENYENEKEDNKTRISYERKAHKKPSQIIILQKPIKKTTTTTTEATTTKEPKVKPTYYPETYKPTENPIYSTTSKPLKKPPRASYHFTSVYYSVADNKCDRIFFIDYGLYKIFGEEIFSRPPVIWAFDIYDCNQRGLDQPPSMKLTIPQDMWQNPSGFSTFDVDVYGNCNEFAIYIANCYDNTIIVYDNVKKAFWYFTHETFKPGAERALVKGPLPPHDSYNFGIVGLILGLQTTYNNYRDLYYSPGSSYGLFKTSTKILRDKSLAPGDPSSSDFSFVGYGGQDSQSIMAYDSQTHVLFFVHLTSNTLQCWNTDTPLEKGEVATLFSDLEYGADILIDGNRNLVFMLYNGDGMLYFDTARTSKSFYSIYRVPIDEIIEGTACDPDNV